MARMIPPSIHSDCKSRGEGEVFVRLRDCPGTSDWIVLHSLDMADPSKQVFAEIDFVIIVPGKGVLCVEVKGTSRIRRRKGLWYYGGGKKSDPRGPFKQAAEAMHTLRRLVTQKDRSLTNIVFWSAVIFPYVDFSATSEEWHSWQVIDSRAFRARSMRRLIENVLDRARDLLAKKASSASWFNTEKKEPSKEQCEAIVQVLRPAFEFYESPKSRSLREEEMIRSFTQDQYMALDAMEENRRVVFSGPAGSGKTMMAIEAARRGNAGGKKVLLLCHNRMLGDWLKDQVSHLAKRVTVDTIISYMSRVAGVETDIRMMDRAFIEALPDMAVSKLSEETRGKHLFDEMILDEGQEMLKEKYLDFLDMSLKGGLAAGKWRIFGDFDTPFHPGPGNLTLEEFTNSRAADTSIYHLKINCRNSPGIARFAYKLAGLPGDFGKILRQEEENGPEILYYTSEREQMDLLASALKRLREEGFTGRDITVLSSRENAESVSRKARDTGLVENLNPYEASATGTSLYSSILAFRGLESPAVVVTDVDDISSPGSSHMLYSAITRALHRAIILADISLRDRLDPILAPNTTRK